MTVALEAKKELENRVIDVLKTIYDPEIPVDIYELGLIYDIRIESEGEVYIKMTLTAPNPAHHALAALQRRQDAIIITQNVDGLHERVAPPGARIHRVHGTIHGTRRNHRL